MKVPRILRSQTSPLLWLAGLATVLTAGAAATQDGGGVLLTFGIDQRVSWDDNPDLDIPSTGDRLRFDTGLSFGVVSETPRDRLAFDLGTVLRGEDDGSGFGFGLESPSAELAYSRLGATSSFTISAFLRETDLGDGLSLIDDGSGGPPVLTFDDGTARTQGMRLAYTWGEGTPFGSALRAGLTDTDYRDTTDPTLLDNRNVTVGAGLRFALNEVTDANFDLDHRRYDEKGPTAAEDSTTFSVGLTRALPRGDLRGKISTTSDEDGTRTGLSFGHSYDLPRGSLSVDLGLTEAIAGGADLTGALAWKQDLPRGAFSVRLSQAVTNDIRNDETLATAFSLGLTQELTPLMGLNMSAIWARSEETATGLVTDSATLDAALSYALTEDWAMNLGASHRIKDEDGVGRANSNSVFLSVGRTFEWRP